MTLQQSYIDISMEFTRLTLIYKKGGCVRNMYAYYLNRRFYKALAAWYSYYHDYDYSMFLCDIDIDMLAVAYYSNYNNRDMKAINKMKKELAEIHGLKYVSDDLEDHATRKYVLYENTLIQWYDNFYLDLIEWMKYNGHRRCAITCPSYTPKPALNKFVLPFDLSKIRPARIPDDELSNWKQFGAATRPAGMPDDTPWWQLNRNQTESAIICRIARDVADYYNCEIDTVIERINARWGGCCAAYIYDQLSKRIPAHAKCLRPSIAHYTTEYSE